MSTIFGHHLMDAVMADESLKESFEMEDSRNEHVCRSFCNTLSFSAGTVMREKVAPDSLAKFDKVLARHLANRLRTVMFSLHGSKNREEIKEVEGYIEDNERFSRRMDEIISETSGMDDKSKIKAARSILIKNLEVPSHVAIACLKNGWTVGELMIRYPRFFLRNFTPEMLDGIY